MVRYARDIQTIRRTGALSWAARRGILGGLLFLALVPGLDPGSAQSSAVDFGPYQTTEIADEYELIIHAIHSPYGNNWESPGALAFSAYKNGFTRVMFRDADGILYAIPNHPISHMAVELRCKGEPVMFTGMTTAKDIEAFIKVFFLEDSFSILGEAQEGRLNTASEVLGELYARYTRITRMENVNFARFIINEHKCAYIKGRFAEYLEDGLDKSYGGAKDRPLKGGGAGCAAFAMSALKVAGFLPGDVGSDYRPAISGKALDAAWLRELWIGKDYLRPAGLPRPEHEPHTLFGALLHWLTHSTFGGDTRAKIGMLDALLREMFDYGDTRWAEPGEAGAEQLVFWDPELFFEWVDAARTRITRHPRAVDPDYYLSLDNTRKNARGIIIEQRPRADEDAVEDWFGGHWVNLTAGAIDVADGTVRLNGRRIGAFEDAFFRNGRGRAAFVAADRAVVPARWRGNRIVMARRADALTLAPADRPWAAVVFARPRPDFLDHLTSLELGEKETQTVAWVVDPGDYVNPTKPPDL